MMNNMMFNFNQMGMNSQQNQMNGMMMDETSQNIRNIIQPYENKIRELEEIIKQKDFEIIVLKQKLNNNNSNVNFMNQMMINMNMNPMNIMMGNMNQQMEDKGKEISLTIISENKKEYIKCFEGDKASIIKEKCNLTKVFLTFNYKLINCDLTIKENGICYNSLIYVKYYMINLIFKNTNGTTNVICLSEDCPVRMALIYYYMKFGKINHIMTNFGGGNVDSLFLYNQKVLKVEDNTPIGEIFTDNPNPLIIVNLLNNSI